MLAATRVQRHLDENLEKNSYNKRHIEKKRSAHFAGETKQNALPLIAQREKFDQSIIQLHVNYKNV